MESKDTMEFDMDLSYEVGEQLQRTPDFESNQNEDQANRI